MGMFTEAVKRLGRDLKTGEILFREGEPGDAMFIIHSGAVQVYRESGEQPVALATLRGGDFFGEMALFDGRPRSASIRALEDTRLLPIPREFLLQHSRKDPSFLFAILEQLVDKLEETEKIVHARLAAGTLSRPAVPPDLPEPKSGPFLAAFREVALNRNFRVLAEGEAAFREGDPAAEMFLLVEGRIALSHTEGGRSLVFSELTKGDFFGERALVSGGRRGGDATARERSILLPVGKELFLERVKTDPAVALHVLQVVVVRLRRALANIEGG